MRRLLGEPCFRRVLLVFTQKIQGAIRLAIAAHAGQTRKGKPEVPYITHPLTVALILAWAGADEEVVTAGVLHDTVEDTDVTLEDIWDQFGERVAELVTHVTEQDKDLPWEERKQQALEHVAKMPQEAVLLKSADVLANLSELVSDLESQGKAVWERFGASREKKIEQQEKLVVAFEKAWPENPLLPEIREKVAALHS